MGSEPDSVLQLDEAVTSRLSAVATRLRRYVLIEGAAWLVGFLVVACLVQFGIDFGLHGVRWSMRAALLAVLLAGAAYVAWQRVLAPWRRRVSLGDVAHQVERRYPELDSVLISAVRFAEGSGGPPASNSPSLMASVVRQAAVRTDSIEFTAVLDPRRYRRGVGALAAAGVIVGMVLLWSPETVALWFSRNVMLSDEPWPRRTHLSVRVDGVELIAARGDDVVIEADATGEQPRYVEIFFTTADGRRGREAMITVGRAGSYRYRYTFKNAQDDLKFHLKGGDDETGSFRLRLLERPRVEESATRIVPPAYTRLDALTLGDGQREARVLPGSAVTIRIHTNKPAARAVLMDGVTEVADATFDGEAYAATVRIDRGATYHFALTDDVGLQNRQPMPFSIRLTRDDPPSVRMKLSGVGDMITPEAVLPIEVQYTDKYGLATAELVSRVLREGLSEELIPLRAFQPGVGRFRSSVAWPVASAGPVPGDQLTLMARATDFDDVSGPNVAQSAERSLRVVTRDELLAELARREQDYRQGFERLVDAQERIRGRVLSIRGHLGDDAAADALATDTARIEREQRHAARNVNGIRQQFEQVLSELRVNRLDTMEEVRRLQKAIIEPLRELATRDLVAAADSIRRWSRDGSASTAAQIDREQAEAVKKMRAVLASMIQWEGYHEVVNMLREIIRLQKALSVEVQAELLREAEDVFED